MPANSNRFDPRRSDGRGTDGRIKLTSHAEERMAARGLRAEAVAAALAYGRIVYNRGADIYAIGRREIARYAEQGIDISAYDGVQVVTSDGAILTAYRNRSFKGLRDRYSHRPETIAVSSGEISESVAALLCCRRTIAVPIP